MTKRLLITQNQLSDYAGSEIVSLELAEQALDLGFAVDILTNYAGLPLSEEFDKRMRILGPDEPLRIGAYSHLWVHHSLVPHQLIEGLLAGKLKHWPVTAFHHMSSYIPLEFPLLQGFEARAASVIYCNSEETKKSFEARGFRPKHMRALGNPAPDAFNREPSAAVLPKPNSVLVVSNHLPPELLKAMRLLRKSGVTVTHAGKGGALLRVTPERLQSFDAVISIGKTVQYCILSAVPVYCYDHFGGPGYLQAKNYEKAKSYNFSGRGFGKKTAEQIANELVARYQEAAKQIARLHKQHAKEHTLSFVLHDFFSRQPGTTMPEIPLADMHQALNTVQAVQGNFRSLIHYWVDAANARRDNEELAIRIEELKAQAEHLTADIEKRERFMRKLPARVMKKVVGY